MKTVKSSSSLSFLPSDHPTLSNDFAWDSPISESPLSDEIPYSDEESLDEEDFIRNEKILNREEEKVNMSIQDIKMLYNAKCQVCDLPILFQFTKSYSI
jgi:hypothetical protein